VSLSGPNSSLAFSMRRACRRSGLQARNQRRKVQLIVLDDGSDPTNAGANARKLVEEEKVDVLMGSSGVRHDRDLAGGTREQDADDGLSPISLPAAEGE